MNTLPPGVWLFVYDLVCVCRAARPSLVNETSSAMASLPSLLRLLYKGVTTHYSAVSKLYVLPATKRVSCRVSVVAAFSAVV
jgi:hypothetical protein